MKIINPPHAADYVAFEVDGQAAQVWILRGLRYTSANPVELYGVMTGSGDDAGQQVLQGVVADFGSDNDLAVRVSLPGVGNWSRPIAGGEWSGWNEEEAPRAEVVSRLDEAAMQGLAILRA